MDIYTKNGVVVRHFPNDDGSTVLNTEFLFEKDEMAELYRLTACYDAFVVHFPTDFVLKTYDGWHIVLMEETFTKAAQSAYVNSLLKAMDKGNYLRAALIKENHAAGIKGSSGLLGIPVGSPVKTNGNSLLEKYKNCDFYYGEFFKECSRIVNEE